MVMPIYRNNTLGVQIALIVLKRSKSKHLPSLMDKEYYICSDNVSLRYFITVFTAGDTLNICVNVP